MMKSIATFMITASLTAGATLCAQTVSFDYDRSANFAGYKTYAWVRGTEVPDQFNHRRIVDAVNGQLTVKGMREASGQPADVLVAYHASFDKNMQINASGWGGYRLGGMRSGTATVDEIVVGTLIVDVVDASTHNIVWRAIASKEINPKASPEKRDKEIQRAVAKLFRNYPGGKTSTSN